MALVAEPFSSGRAGDLDLYRRDHDSSPLEEDGASEALSPGPENPMVGEDHDDGDVDLILDSGGDDDDDDGVDDDDLVGMGDEKGGDDSSSEEEPLAGDGV